VNLNLRRCCFGGIGLMSSALLACFAPLAAQTKTKTVPILFVWKGNDTGLLLGASQGGTWLTWQKTYRLLKGGEGFQFYGPLSKAGQATGKKPELAPASGSAYLVSLSNLKAAQTTLIGLKDATWNPQPRVPTAFSPQSATYKAAVTEFLKTKGLRRSKPVIAALWQIDLEGDGVAEVLIEAHSPNFDKVVSMDGPLKAGDFSVILLRRVVSGKPQMTMLLGEIYKKAEAATPNRFALSHVLDLNGDGKMEIVVEWNYYEGGGANVIQMVNGRPKPALEASDGA
jgi:hypothetical protein